MSVKAITYKRQYEYFSLNRLKRQLHKIITLKLYCWIYDIKRFNLQEKKEPKVKSNGVY